MRLARWVIYRGSTKLTPESGYSGHKPEVRLRLEQSLGWTINLGILLRPKAFCHSTNIEQPRESPLRLSFEACVHRPFTLRRGSIMDRKRDIPWSGIVIVIAAGVLTVTIIRALHVVHICTLRRLPRTWCIFVKWYTPRLHNGEEAVDRGLRESRASRDG
jgi:hypothetical protein